MTNPTTPFNWQMPTSSDLVTDLPADFETFGQAVATSMADLLGGTTGQVLSKASNTDMDFTWVAQDDSNAIQNAIVDAKGDLIAASAADTPARLAVGANNTVLIADSSQSTGLRWGGAWTSWTPTFVNFTLGNGTVTASYQQIGKTVNFYLRVILGSTSSVSGAIGFSLPATNLQSDVYVNGAIYDTGVQNFASTGILYDGYCYVRLLPAGGTYTTIAAVSSTTPMTWTSGDIFFSNGSYEVV